MLEVVQMCEGVERESLLDLWRAGSLNGANGFVARRRGEAFVLSCPEHPECILLNRAMSGGGAANGVRWLEDAVSAFAEAGVSRFLLQPPPQTGEDFEHQVLEHGYQRFRRRWAKFVRRRQPVARAATDLEVRPVEDRYAEDFARILVGNLEMPPLMVPFYANAVGLPHWHGFVALDGGRAVAAGALFERDGVGYLAGGATERSHRGRGAQSALLSARLDLAGRLGCRWTVSETGEAVDGEPNHSYNNMLRAGFEVVYSRANFVGPARKNDGGH